MPSSAVCCLRIDRSFLSIDRLGRPRDFIAAGPFLFFFGGVLLSDFLLNCFDLLFDLLPKVDNLLIVLPFFAILISVMLSLTFKFIRGDYK